MEVARFYPGPHTCLGTPVCERLQTTTTASATTNLYCALLRRYYNKASSPCRSWMHTAKKFPQSAGIGGRPPIYPNYNNCRRGSNSPGGANSPLTCDNRIATTPNRSRSLDGLLDDVNGCSTANNKSVVDASAQQQVPNENPSPLKAHSCDNLDEVPTVNGDAISLHSVHSNESSKRKRNFMDLCVNKVRSLMKK